MKNVAFEMNISRRNFYHAIKMNNTELINLKNFTQLIDEISYNHINEYELPPKIKMQNPNMFKNLYLRSYYSYRDIARITGISYVTINKYLNNSGYMDFKKTKTISDLLSNKN